MSKMAESRHTTGKMAVTSDNHEIRENMAREEVEQKFIANSIRPGIDVVPAKKKTFKITSVKLNDTNDGDSMDDLDESHTEMTEDYSSELLDTSRATDYEQETPSATEDIPLTNQTIRPVTDGKEKSDMHSRFRVVKIETKEPFHRGRWICLDYLDPLPPVNTEKSDTKVYEEVNSGSSSAGSSIHYIHGVDDPAKNPLLAGATGTVYFTSVLPPESTNNQETFQPIHPAPNTQPNMNSNPQSQLSSIGYFTDHSSQGQGSQLMCQTLNQSQSHQSISSLASTDIIQHTSGQPMIGDVHSGNPASQHAGSHTQNDSTNVGNIPKPNVYMPHFSGGQPLSMYPQNIQSTSMISSVVNSRPTSASSQDQSSNTYQTYVHLGQQIANTSVVQGNQSESIPSDVASEKKSNINASDVPSSNNDRTIVDETTGQIISSPFKDNLTGALDKDLNVIQNQNALSPALVAAVGDLQSPQEEEQGGSSTVAIDNKIEQAMDLVKSHLMFAVREEVEVLREQIAELIERNNQLEYENGILRAAASPETLAKLAQPRQQQPPSSSSSS